MDEMTRGERKELSRRNEDGEDETMLMNEKERITQEKKRERESYRKRETDGRR